MDVGPAGTTIWMEDDEETVLRRFLGCLMVTAMPRHGLDEALFSLRDAFDFYSLQALPALPSGSPPVELRGSLLPARERPEFTGPD